ncbi:hypothetical protein [Marinitoga sp. 1155]|uniref:hypothetical protein n=1 Tax=Marinitoga sp. 1155 TaxID=1428448 RepID=UPI000641304A|nr:hypothetical protein [Marinitoga sp. 1155]KLO21946.1 hypothetical protein X274_09370 [Marinitoga sp. 1155]
MSLFKKDIIYMLMVAIYIYLFIFGAFVWYVIVKLIPKFKVDFDIFLYIFGLLFLTLGYFIGKKISLMKNIPYINVGFPPFLGIIMSFLLSLFMISERLIKLRFVPFFFWQSEYFYFRESGFVGIGFKIASISAIINYIFYSKYKNSLKKNKRILLIIIILLEVFFCILYGRSRSVFLPALIIYIWYYIKKNQLKSLKNNFYKKKIWIIIIMILLFFILYRGISIFNRTKDINMTIYESVVLLSPEYKDLSFFIDNYRNSHLTELKKQIINNLYLVLLPEYVWEIVGIDKNKLGNDNLGKEYHYFLFGNYAAGTRLTVYGDLYILGGKRLMHFGALILGFFVGLMSKRKKSFFSFILSILFVINQYTVLHNYTITIEMAIIISVFYQKLWKYIYKSF